jgi:hypothetical protein
MKKNDRLMARIVSPFRVGSHVFTEDHIGKVIDRLANVPVAFEGMDIIGALPDEGGSIWPRQEAQNRLFQRWRKMGLMKFSKGKWRLEKGAWDTLQAAALRCKEARI